MVKYMSILDRVEREARAALESLRQQARQQAWDTERIEQAKNLYELSHEVTLCSRPGCLTMAQPFPGFRDLRCERHQQPPPGAGSG